MSVEVVIKKAVRIRGKVVVPGKEPISVDDSVARLLIGSKQAAPYVPAKKTKEPSKAPDAE